MILKGNRQEEILQRARERSVTAAITMAVPGMASVKNLGVIVDDKKPLLSLTAGEAFSQGAHVWQQEDFCVPEAEKNPALLKEILDALSVRMAKLKAQQSILRGDEQKAVFDSADLVDKATGIPTRLRIDFYAAAQPSLSPIDTLPFPKLKDFTERLQEKLTGLGGTLLSIDIAHGAKMSAFDYYEMEMKRYAPGQKFSYGHIMLARAYNFLKDAGVPLVLPPGRTMN